MLVNLTFASPVIGFLAFIGTVLSTGLYIGSRFFPMEPLLLRFAGGFTISTALLAILGAALYYLIPLNSLILTCLLSTFILGAAIFSQKPKPAPPLPSNSLWWVFILQLIFLAPWWHTLSTTMITEALRSPWDVISPLLLLSLGLASICSLLIIWRGNRQMSLISLALLVLSAVSITSLAYPIGFGFDPFIHQATVQHILEYGTITPKPLYYIGQYALELILSGVFYLPLTIVDQWLIPLLTAIILPTAAIIGGEKSFSVKKRHYLIALFFLPFIPFIFTTPQSLAYLFTIASLLFSLPFLAKESSSLTIPAILAIAAIITHPLAGIPAILFILLIAGQKIHQASIRIFFSIFWMFFASISLPIVFILQSKMSDLSFTWDLSAIFHIETIQAIGFNPWVGLANIATFTIPALAILVALWGFWYALKTDAPMAWHLPLLASIAWCINFLLLRAMKFDFLIEYEQANYADRLLVLAMIFLLPALMTGILAIEQRLRGRATMHYALILSLALLFTMATYLAYPRNDGSVRSAGFNIAQTDIDAAHAIAQHAEDTDYLVLANQAVSAAALREFGFLRYYHETLFYYPIPTSSPLYEDYLLMADENPSREIAEEVLRETGAERLYFVLNDYWWNADATAESAKKQADDWFSIGNGAILIFVYE